MQLRAHLARTALVLVFASVGASSAFAQGQTDSHHPPTTAPTQPAAPLAPGQGGMMGPGMMGGQGGRMGPNGMCAQMMGQGDMMGGQGGMMGQGMMQMMPMMQNMMAMMSAETGMMAPFVEGRIAALKTELKITDAQTANWNRFADTLRATAKSMNDMHQRMMTIRTDKAAKPLPDRLAAREQAMAAHLAALKAEREALQPLYASFSDEQKKIADGLRIGPMGMM